MPWTVKNPPDVAKNWSLAAKKKCVVAANAVLEDGGTDEKAIYACIHAAGKGDRNMSVIQQLWERVKAAFDEVIERRIKDVDSWDGSASRWPTTEAYCDDCLIDVNAAAGRKEKAQSHCMLPVRGPDDAADVYVRQAVYAAAAGRGLGRVKRPADVPEDAWKSAVKAAANKIISAYQQMDAVAPDAIYQLAGKTPPERATAWQSIFEQVSQAVQGMPEFEGQYPWINDLYQDGERTVAIICAGGKVYRTEVAVDDSGVKLGTPVEVTIQFAPRSRHAFTVTRQADGKVRWFAITETAVLLRVGEIDSRALFDSCIAHAESTGEYPVLRFYHDPRLDFGRADWLAREDNCYLASGIFTEDHPLAVAFLDAVEHGRGRWGTSNGFEPTAEPELWGIANGVTIPVYTAGIHREISVLPENEAASWFTTVTPMEVTRMRDRVKQALVELFGDEARAKAFIEQVDATNREITEQGLITRADEQQPNTDEQPNSGAEGGASTTEEVWDETKLGEVAAAVMDKIGADLTERVVADVVEALTPQLKELRQRVDTMPSLEPVTAQLEALEQRVAGVERTDEEKRQAWQADLPVKPRVAVTYRPRQQSGEKHDYAQIADSTLAKMPVRTGTR